MLSMATIAKSQLPVVPAAADQLQYTDWLVQPVTTRAGIYTNTAGDELILYNGLLKRKFSLRQNLVCTEYRNMRNGQQLLRAGYPPRSQSSAYAMPVCLVSARRRRKRSTRAGGNERA